jgi:hypothetical protein
MLVRLVSAGIAVAAIAFGPTVRADELPAPRIRATKAVPSKSASRTQGLRPATSPAQPTRQQRQAAPLVDGDLQAIDLGTSKRVAPVAMAGPSEAYRALERRIYGRSRGATEAPDERRPKSQPAQKQRVAATAKRLRTPAVRPLDLRKTYAPDEASAGTRITADQQQAESGRIATRSRRGAKPVVLPAPAVPPTLGARAPVKARAAIIEPVTAPQPRRTTGAGVIPPDPEAPAIPRGPGAIRRLDVPGCLDGT